MLDLTSLNKTVGTNPGDTLELLQHSIMVLQCAFQNELGVIDLPSPLSSDRVGVMSPAISIVNKRHLLVSLPEISR